LFVISIYVIGIVPLVVHNMAVDGRTEGIASVKGVIGGYNAAETVVAEGMGETTLAESVEVLPAIDTRIHLTQQTNWKARRLFVVEPRARIPLAGLFGMELEGCGDGEGAAVAELGVVVVRVSYESSAGEVGVETTVNPGPYETVTDGSHAGDPVDGVPFQSLAPFQEGFPYSR
jgi:hypothetical protein